MTRVTRDNRPKRELHAVDEDGMVLCNPCDREAAHRAEMEGIAPVVRTAVTCRKCSQLLFGRAREERERTRQQFGPLFGAAAEILCRLDPIRIVYGERPNAYQWEVGTILPRLEQATSQADALQIVHQEFVRWFGERIAGDRENYQEAAAQLWRAWEEWKSRHTC